MSTDKHNYYNKLRKNYSATTQLSGEAEIKNMYFTESNGINHNNNNNNNNGNLIENPNHKKMTSNNDVDENNVEERDNDDSELMPYTPNSVDRSSVGSIPWADDAIKQNQLYWERIERMLAGEEQPLPEEPELAQEIQEWRQKFSHLLGPSNKRTIRNIKIQDQSFNDSVDIDALSDLSFDFSDNDDLQADEDPVTPTLKYPRNFNNILSPHKQFYNDEQPQRIRQAQRLDSVGDLAQLLGRNLRISSVPISWRKQVKYAISNNFGKDPRSETSTTQINSPAAPPPPPPRRYSPTFNSLIIAPSKPKLPPPPERKAHGRMPPVLNVLETKRRFRGLTNNRSFVQLTAAKQTKSAALTQQKSSKTQSAWHMPLAATTVGKRFFNQRNSVILPSINLRRIHEVPSSASSSSSISPKGLNSLQNYNMKSNNYEPDYNYQPQYLLPAGRSSFSSNTASTSGRSISAAVHHPRFELNAFYLPYSAANKFKSFNKI